ncbi:hypothetical protein EG329_000669 [Mollisiaceae sp. DMI_Dod_QoI]|nr:hypothetical protein EG329_000669 [Helotiales sp. DMI_Dod_QoI]
MEPILQPSSQTPPTPQITSSTSPSYQHRLADISSRACLSDPLNILFQRDHHPNSSALPTLSTIYTSTLSRITTKISLGSTIIEADNFAAVACWEPPSSIRPPYTSTQLLELAQTRPIYAIFNREMEEARKECLGEGQKCWQLSLMARDPERTSKGAVRAVIEPLVQRAREEEVPVWCVAGNERARDVYAFFGFRVVRVICLGEEGVRCWCMVCNWPVE